MNNVQITARLSAAPKLRNVGELEICDLRVAIPRRKGRDGTDRGAVFIDVTTFGPLAKICGQYLAKGRRVAVNGRLELEEWEASDGSPRRRHKIVAEQVEFLDPASRPSGEPAEVDEQPAESDEATVDELAAKREQHDQPSPVQEPVAA
jgi:single-strand DNA-binding protein